MPSSLVYQIHCTPSSSLKQQIFIRVVNSAAVGAYRLNDPPTLEEWKNMLASTGLKVVTVREHISQSFDADCEMIENTYERPPKHVSKSSKKRKRSEPLTIPKKSEKHRAK